MFPYKATGEAMLMGFLVVSAALFWIEKTLILMWFVKEARKNGKYRRP
jgi:hypothetical protein